MDIDYGANLSRIEAYKVDWDKPMEDVTPEYLYNKLSQIQSYRSSIVSLVKDALSTKALLFENFRGSEINYENNLRYLMVTDPDTKAAKSDKGREAIADMKPDVIRLKKQAFEDEKKLSRIEAYIKALDGYLKDLDKQADVVQNQIFLLNLDIKIHPDRLIKLT